MYYWHIYPAYTIKSMSCCRCPCMLVIPDVKADTRDVRSWGTKGSLNYNRTL